MSDLRFAELGKTQLSVVQQVTERELLLCSRWWQCTLSLLVFCPGNLGSFLAMEIKYNCGHYQRRGPKWNRGVNGPIWSSLMTQAGAGKQALYLGGYQVPEQMLLSRYIKKASSISLCWKMDVSNWMKGWSLVWTSLVDVSCRCQERGIQWILCVTTDSLRWRQCVKCSSHSYVKEGNYTWVLNNNLNTVELNVFNI